MLRGTSVSVIVSMFLAIFIDGFWSPELLGHMSPVVSVLRVISVKYLISYSI